MKRTDQERKQAMYRILAQWDKSNLNQKAFCVMRGINYSVFKYWNKKRKSEGANNAAKTNNQQKEPPVKKNTESFIPLTLKQKLKSQGLSITYPNGVEVACPDEMDLDQFKLMVQIY
jgi:hypothetical protein